MFPLKKKKIQKFDRIKFFFLKEIEFICSWIGEKPDKWKNLIYLFVKLCLYLYSIYLREFYIFNKLS